jgi:nitrite reductase/ring-hydroxylating ferredoxin subunit
MKKIFFVSVCLPIFWSCSNNKIQNKNPFLPEYNVEVSINLNLPSYNTLKFAGNAVYYPNVGVRGIFIFNTGSGYTAFDAACPNQSLSECSTMTLKGINAVCSCDSKEYSLYTGLGGLQYPLKQYRVEAVENTVRVYN